MEKKYSVDLGEKFKEIDDAARQMLSIDKNKDFALYIEKRNELWVKTYDLINEVKKVKFYFVDDIRTYDIGSEIDIYYDALQEQLEKYNDESKSFAACVFTRGKWDTISSYKNNYQKFESIDDEDNYDKDEVSMLMTQDVSEEVIGTLCINHVLLEIGSEVIRLKEVKPTKSSGYYHLFYTESVTNTVNIEQELKMSYDAESKIWNAVEKDFINFFCIHPVLSLKGLGNADGKPLGYFDDSSVTDRISLAKGFPLIVFSKYIRETNPIRDIKLSEAFSSISEWKKKYKEFAQGIIF